MRVGSMVLVWWGALVAVEPAYLKRVALRLVLLTQVVGQRGGPIAVLSCHRGGCSPKTKGRPEETSICESVVNSRCGQEGCRCAGDEDGEGEGGQERSILIRRA